MVRHGGREGQETGVEVGSPRESEEGMEGKGKNPAEEQAVTQRWIADRLICDKGWIQK